MPPYAARHYDILVKPIDQAPQYLDQKHQLGWRVVKMTVHPTSHQLIFLLEKTVATPKE